MKMDFTSAQWLNPPKQFEVTTQSVKLVTEPGTDFWQRSYYGFRNDNSPALLIESDLNFTFTVRASFEYRTRFDQCGLVIYLNSDNWCKLSAEYEDERLSRLGSVVTNLGYSDWATTDIAPATEMWYRLSRRGPDFLIESSIDGTDFKQMRIFHLHTLGETTVEMASGELPAQAEPAIRFGLYASSPLNGSFVAVFDQFKFEPCLWLAHGAAE